MSSDFKLDIATQHDMEEPLLSTALTSKRSQDEKTNVVHTIFNGIREQGKLSMSNFATNAERRSLSDRSETILLLKSCTFSLDFHLLLSSCMSLFSFFCLHLCSVSRKLIQIILMGRHYKHAYLVILFRLSTIVNFNLIIFHMCQFVQKSISLNCTMIFLSGFWCWKVLV